MHRLSRISATFTGRKGEGDGPSSANTVDESSPPRKSEGDVGPAGDHASFQRPNVLPLKPGETPTDKHGNAKSDDEWFEMVSTSPSAGPSSPLVTAMDSDALSTPDTAGNPQIEIQTPSSRVTSSRSGEDAVEFEITEQSLLSLLDDFRSGRMNALSEERLSQMRNARREMEELTALHVKLHLQQVSNPHPSSGNDDQDEQYDALFRRLDKLHNSMRLMSFDDVTKQMVPQNDSDLTPNESSTA